MKKFIQGLIVSSFILLSSLTVFAADNDGKATDNPVCDSGFPSSFKDAQYYDVALPYTLTAEDIGGYSTGSKEGNTCMADSTKSKVVCDLWSRESDHTSSCLRSNVKDSSHLTFSDNSDNYCIATDENGTQYYILAIAKYFYNSSTGIQWGAGTGQVIEIYFTDGKYLRAIVGDAKAEGHTNGGVGSTHEGTYNKNDGWEHYYYFSDLKYNVYQNLFQAVNGEVFEWFCTGDAEHKTPAELAGSSGKPSYVRMYNLNVADDASPTLNDGVAKEAVSSSTSAGGNYNGGASQSQANTTTGYAGGFYSEMDISAYAKLSEENIQETYLDKATRDNLNQNDLENLASWEDNVTNSKKEYGFIAWMRIIVMWVGIVFTIYIFLIYLAFWFDKLNSIIDLDVLSILTFGRLHVAIDDKEANFSLGKKQDRMTVSHKDMLFICITGLIFGTLLITGTFYKIVANFVNFILRSIG